MTNSEEIQISKELYDRIDRFCNKSVKREIERCPTGQKLWKTSRIEKTKNDQ